MKIMEENGFFTRMAVRTAALIPFTLCAAIVSIASPVAAGPRELTVDEAVKIALSSDGRVESGFWDAEAAARKVDEARRRMLPSVSLSAGYTRLSELSSSITLGSIGTVYFGSLENAFSLSANVQYPVFAGFRLRESTELAELQSQAKSVTVEMTKRAVAFETQRAYWEAVRASNNVRMLGENLALAKQSRDVTASQLAHGTAMNADLLAADMRRDQAEMDLAGAETMMTRAFLSLAALVSADGTESIPGDASSAFVLSSKPEELTGEGAPDGSLSGNLAAGDLIATAIARRPESRASGLAVRMAESGRKIAEAPLYPTVAVTGNYTYADPNPRSAFQSDPWKFTGTWSVGVSLSYDLGGLPANLSAREAQIDGEKKSASDARRQGETIALDVRNCLASRDQILHDLPLVTRMLDQAKENERVTGQKVLAGTASQTDLLAAQFARLRSEFGIANRQIDLQIATADLSRATAIADIE